MGNVFGTHALHLTHGVRRAAAAVVVLLTLAACGTAPPEPPPGMPVPMQPPPPLPDTGGWGPHVLALAATPNRSAWAGTWDNRLLRLPFRARTWDLVPTAGGPPGPINSIAFERDTLVLWYGTAGGGFGRTADGGRTWQTWPRTGGAWSYVVPRGILVRRDTAFVATTDGLRYTGDGGATWRCVQGPRPAGATPPDDGCGERIESLPTSHLLSIEFARDGSLHVGHLGGLSRSTDRGRTWTHVATEGIAGERVRSVRVGRDSAIWALTETALFADSPRFDGFRRVPLRVPGIGEVPGAPRAIVAQPGLAMLVATSYGMLGEMIEGGFRLHFLAAADRYRPSGDIWTGIWWGPPWMPIGGAAAGINRILAGESPVPAFLDLPPRIDPVPGRHLRFVRPVRTDDGNPYPDGTALFGMTPPRTPAPSGWQRYLNPAGTPVRAVATGTVVRADAGTVVIRHDEPVGGRTIFSSYALAGPVQVAQAQRVEAGALLGTVGRDDGPTGVRLAVHALESADTAQLRTAAFPLPGAVNPALWIEPLPGTGIVAGRVLDAAGEAVPGVAVHGLVVAYPTEAPFSIAVTRTATLGASPVYGEHFAVGDVPEGDYTVGVLIDGQRVWRRIRVAPGMVTWVEFSP